MKISVDIPKKYSITAVHCRSLLRDAHSIISVLQIITVGACLTFCGAGCAMVPVVAEKQSGYASPVNEFSEDFCNNPDNVFAGGLVSEDDADGHRTMRFQFPNVLVGEDRILDLYLYQNALNGVVEYIKLSESHSIMQNHANAVLRGYVPSPVSMSVTSFAEKSDVPYAFYLSLSQTRRAMREYPHRGSFFCEIYGANYAVKIVDDLKWRERSRVKSMLMRFTYIVAIPVDVVQAITPYLGFFIWNP